MTEKVKLAPPPTKKREIFIRDEPMPLERAEIIDNGFKSPKSRFRFTVGELCELWGVTTNTVMRRIKGIPSAPKVYQEPKCWNLADVTRHVDMSNPDMDEAGLNAQGKLQLFKANDMEQAFILKQIKVAQQKGSLLEADEIERVVAKMYKGLVMFMDNLPDILERKGLIDREDVTKVARLIDRTRDQMADDIAEMVNADDLEQAKLLQGDADEH